MRIIITGGTGLIGSALTTELVKDGYDVILLSRSPGAGVAPSGVRLVGWDGRTSEGWGHLAEGAGAIINLAAANIAGDGILPQRWTPERKASILQSRLNAGQAVVSAVREAVHKPELVIQASAIGYYGSRSQPVTELAASGDDFLAQVCRQWEASTQAVEQDGVRRAVIRIGVVLSAKGGALPRQMLPYRFFVGGPIGSGQQGYSWIHLDDVVGAIRFLIAAPEAQGCYNLTAPNPLTHAQFGRLLGAALGRPDWLGVPGWAFRLAFGEVASVLLDGQFVLPERLLKAGYDFVYPQVDQALKNILQPA